MSSEVKKRPELYYANITESQHLTIDALYEGNKLVIAAKGHGKAVCGQTAAQALLDDGEVKRVLIIAPLKVCALTWATEWLKWDHLEKPAMAIGDAAIRELAIDSGARITIINIENVPWMFKKYGHRHGFDGLLIDELSKFKGVGGVAVKVLRKHLRDFTWRAGLTASPVAEQGVDIYAQALIIDGGKALGRNQDNFRRRYFYPTDFEQRKWALLPGFGPQLAEALADIIYVADDEAYEAALPELRDEVVHVVMPLTAWDSYTSMCEAMYIEAPDIEAPNQAVVSGKLLQITAGAVYDDTGMAHWLHTAKLEALKRLVDGADGPVIVAYQFLFELAALREYWPDITVLGENPEHALAAWNRGEVSLMAVHPKSAAHGINAQFGGHELIILSPIWSADANEQLLGRIRRRGQASPFVRRTVLVVPGTIDELIMSRLLNKAEDEGNLLGHIRSACS